MNKIVIYILSFVLVASFGFLYGITDNEPKGNSLYKENNNLKIATETIIQPTKNQPTVKTKPVDSSRKNISLASRQDNEASHRITPDNGYLGKFRVTRYCPCEKCCGKWAANRQNDENGIPIAYGASGNRLNSGYSCAADTSLPFGTKLYIPQIDMTVTVEDRAAKSIEQRYNGKFIDLYFTDHAHYIEGASDYMEVYIVD